MSVIRQQLEIDEADNERRNDIIFAPQKAACEATTSQHLLMSSALRSRAEASQLRGEPGAEPHVCFPFSMCHARHFFLKRSLFW